MHKHENGKNRRTFGEATPQNHPAEKSVSRREFIVNAAFVGAGAVALTGAAPTTALAEASKETAAAPKSAGGGKKLDEVLKAAREALYPRCRVCPECDGWACSGEVPGFGGIGSGRSFRSNVDALNRLQLKMKSVHDVKKPDTSVTLFGEKLAFPILSAATGGTTYNMGGKMSEEDYVDAILGGSLAVGSMGLVADGTEETLQIYQSKLGVLAAHKGKGIAIMKPRAQDEVIKRVKAVEATGALAFGIDIDSAGRAARAAVAGMVIEPKTIKQLKEIVRSTKLPFILKGVMTPEEAEIAVEIGAAGVLVSNHGGRVLDHTPGTAEVLPDIAKKVKGKLVILVDGGIRYGADVLKMLALGADAVLVGRPTIRGAYGGGREGVALILKKMKNELDVALILTGTADVKKVRRDILA
jgi:isopentenyl diphosphate isomerase/L-lactate dehydrogenase-like FMN-dependent dehydrogenase